VQQLHSSAYRNAEQFARDSRVLVVGAANSGLQIAEELATQHEVTVAVGAAPPQLPQRVLGRDLFFWLTKIGALTKPADSRLARRMRERGDIVVGTSTKDLRRSDVDFRPRLRDFAGRVAEFDDGSTCEVDAVVWATGFRSDYSWIKVAGVVEPDGSVLHANGVTHAPGLYFVGLPWQTSRGSALLGFVGRDAAGIADRITTRITNHPTPSSPDVTGAQIDHRHALAA
jgi:putative flavoprotein involved in K+ transport